MIYESAKIITVCHRGQEDRSLYLASNVAVGHGDLDVLNDGALDVLHRLLAAVGDADVGDDGLAMVVDVLVQVDFHVEFPWREGEALGNKGARLAPVAAGGTILDLPDGEVDGVALVGLLVSAVSNEHLQIVDDSQRLDLKSMTQES